MKPCYCYGEELLVLAELIKDGETLWHSCKARISQGKHFSITLVNKEVAKRAGWWTLPDGGVSHEYAPVVLHCKLRVGRCQHSTDVHIIDEDAFPEKRGPFDWHIHLGESDMKALEGAGWEADICYLDGLCKKGLVTHLAQPPLCCTSSTDALSKGHEDCMRYWHGRPCVSLANIFEGQKWVWRSLHHKRNEEEHRVCEEAARQPSAEALMYVHDVLGMSCDEGTCAAAATAGSINCLSYAHCSGCPWGAEVCTKTAAAGSAACLGYAREHGCQWDSGTFEAAAWGGHLDCLVYAHTHGCQWDKRTCSKAAARNNLEMLAYAFEHGCPWDGSTCAAAASAGSLECLAYAHEHDCPWISPSFGSVALGSRPQCPDYKHWIHCGWYENTLYAAAKAGHLNCLMYAHKHGCPYDTTAPRKYCDRDLSFAAVKGKMSFPCLKYVHESMGCSWLASGVERKCALLAGRCDVLKYIHMHGGSWCDEEQLEEQDLRSWDMTGHFEEQARCLLYMYCCGGCKLPPLRSTNTRMRVLALLQDRRAAVLLSFQAAGRVQAGTCTADAAHVAMHKVPADLIKQIVCTAKLLIAE